MSMMFSKWSVIKCEVNNNNIKQSETLSTLLNKYLQMNYEENIA